MDGEGFHGVRIQESMAQVQGFGHVGILLDEAEVIVDVAALQSRVECRQASCQQEGHAHPFGCCFLHPITPRARSSSLWQFHQHLRQSVSSTQDASAPDRNRDIASCG